MPNHNSQSSQVVSGEFSHDFETSRFYPEKSLVSHYEETPRYVESAYATAVDPRPIGRFGVEQSLTPERVDWTPESLRLLMIAEQIQLSRGQHPLLITELDTTSEVGFFRSVLKKLINFEQD